MSQTEMTRKIGDKTLFRSVSLSRESVNEDDRTVSLAFSSELPVERYFGMEILDHSSDSVVLDGLVRGGPVLVGHDSSDHVGVVESVSIDADRRGRAVVRFGRSARAEEIFNDIKDGIRNNVSVGYRILDAVVEKRGKNGKPDVVRVMKWRPFELSIVSVPADDTVGVGRGGDETKLPIIEVRQMENEVVKVDTSAIERDARNQARNAELARIREVTAIGEKFGMQKEAREFLESDNHVNAFKDLALGKLESRSVETMQPKTQLDMSKSEERKYSLMAAIRAADAGDWSKAGFERECSIAVSEQLGRDAKGFFLPFNIQTRTMTVGTPSTGGYLVDTKLDSANFIDRLRARSVVTQLGATMLTGLVGDVDVPKKTGSATFYWVGEDVEPTNSNVTVGQLSLRPRTIAGAVPITRKLMKQSSIDVEMMVLNDLAIGASLGLDRGALRGTGVDGEPLGVTATTGINTQAIASNSAPTWLEMIGFETAIAADDADVGNLSYLTTPAIRGTLKGTVKDAGSGQFVWAEGTTPVNGYRALVSSQLAADTILFGNWNDVVIGMWGVIDIQPDKATKAATGGLVLRVFQDIDVGVRNVESFCLGT